MKGFRRKLAVFMTMLLVVPSLVVRAEGYPVPKEMVEASQQEGEEKQDNPSDTQEKQLGENKEEITEPNMTPAPVIPDEEEMTEAVKTPEPVKEPEATMVPEVSAIPETTPSPEISEPSASSSPEMIPDSEHSGLPEAIESPGTTASPEITPIASATPEASPLSESIEADEISFNTGNHEWSIVTREAFEQEKGDGYYEDDGSYIINIPEANPFFPYEVQFTYNGEVTSQWFMTPEDSVDIGGHIFYISAYFDNTAITQMSLNVAGDTVTVWPEKKEFTDEDEGGISEISLFPLPEKKLTVDLSAYTPIELTMVSIDSIFNGTEQLTNADKVIWTYDEEDDYSVSASGSLLDLSYHTAGKTSTVWQMIVGQADQLATDNTRYIVELKVRDSREWLLAEAYYLDSSQNRVPVTIADSYYSDYEQRTFAFLVPFKEMKRYLPNLKLKVNPSVFGSTVYDHFRIYEGEFSSAAEAVNGRDITDYLCETDKNYHESFGMEWITIVTFDSSNNETGCLPIYLFAPSKGNGYEVEIHEGVGNDRKDVIDSYTSSVSGEVINWSCTLKPGYKADLPYYINMYQTEDGIRVEDTVIALYEGLYPSQEEAISDGAVDIKDSVFGSDTEGGYNADFSKGVYFTLFEKLVGVGGYTSTGRRQFCITVEEGEDPAFNSGTSIHFLGLKDRSGVEIPSYVFPCDGDSYAESNYLTILVGADVDLTCLAPIFSTDAVINLYASGSNTPEVSGVSQHDFSGGAVQYTASAENGTNAKNYWLQVVKAANGTGQLYINSLKDPAANTRIENGILYSTREMMLDGYHNYVHDIWLANMGTLPIPALSAELISDVVELDNYWTLNGNLELPGFSTTNKPTGNKGELYNLAKLRVLARDGVPSGTDISGILRIKSGESVLMELTLTGTVGDPCIITEEIPEAVKYVPYGSMIQNNNKYSWNKVKYNLTKGVLPAGMQIKPNGELYGVPLETGEFTFTVRMESSYEGFSSGSKTFTLRVIENTDANVEASTDDGYGLIRRVQNIYLNMLGGGELPSDRRTLVSEGQYVEFVDIYLDGVKLTPGTDYISEAGSTRITILTQTLAQGGTVGSHTLGVEFRTGDTNLLRRAAQNYRVEAYGEENNTGTDGEDGGNNRNDFESENDGGMENGNSSVAENTVRIKEADNGNLASLRESGRTIVYTVEAGDSLWKISLKLYG